MEIRNICIGKGQPKICLPIVASTHEEAINQISTFHHYDLVELRIDYYENLFNKECVLELLKQIRELLTCPIIFTYRSLKEGGHVQLTDEQYKELVTYVCESQLIDLIDIEINSGNQLVYELVEIAHHHHIYVIMSNHDFKQTISKEDMIDLLEKMDILGADILKIAMMPRNYEDVIKMLEVSMNISSRIKKPLIAISMGELGKITRICGELTGSCITFGSALKSSAPGQIEVSKLKMLLEAIHDE